MKIGCGIAVSSGLRRRGWFWCGALAALTIGAGCSHNVRTLDSRERADARMVEARALEEAGNLDEALRRYLEALYASPDLAMAHLRAAFIYQDHRADMVMALYHYRRYRELRPGAEKEEMILMRESHAKAAMLAAFADDAGANAPTPGQGAPPIGGSMAERLGELTKERDALLAEVKRVGGLQSAESERASAAEAQLAAARERLALAETEIQHALARERAAIENAAEQARRRDAIEKTAADCEAQLNQARQTIAALRLENRPGAVAAPPSPPPPAPVVGRPALPARHVVKAGETLSGIALYYYGDALKWRPIFVANEAVLGASGRLRPGQVLRIPVIEEP